MALHGVPMHQLGQHKTLWAIGALLLLVVCSSTGQEASTGPTRAAAAGVHGPDIVSAQSMQQGMDLAANQPSSMYNIQQQLGTRFLQAQNSVNYAADAVNRHPAVHGWVQKAGMADLASWHGNYTRARLESFTAWRADRKQAGGPGTAWQASYTCKGADHPPMPFPGCHVFVNHKYKYIYIRSPKSASTSIVDMLGECDNVRTTAHNSSSCMMLHYYWPQEDLQLETLQRVWKDYFVFGFVRNPWKRAYSLYKYLHSNACMAWSQLDNPNCKVPWSRFCLDPWAAADELVDRGCIWRSKAYLHFHIADQHHCMRTAEGNWAVDFMGRVDQPNEDWAEVIRTVNAKRAPGTPELPINALEQQNVRTGGHKDPYDTAHMHCFDAVSRWYACDIENYGFANAAEAQLAEV